MQEQQNQINIYSFLQKAVYFIVLFECLILFFGAEDIKIISNILKRFA